MINWGKLLKRCIQAVFLVWAMPPAILGGFGRIEALFTLFAQHLYVRAQLYPKLWSRGLLQDDAGRLFHRRGDWPGQLFFKAWRRSAAECLHWRLLSDRPRAHRSAITDFVACRNSRRTLPAFARQPWGTLKLNTIEESGHILTIGGDCWIGGKAIVMANIARNPPLATAAW